MNILLLDNADPTDTHSLIVKIFSKLGKTSEALTMCSGDSTKVSVGDKLETHSKLEGHGATSL